MDQDFFAGDPATVAEQLIGCYLIHETAAGTLRGRIVETEAYYGNHDVEDPASHAFNGKTERNKVMFGPPGRSYVYLCYGIHTMLNVTTGNDGVPSAILLRAAEPVDGVDKMQNNRGINDVQQLCNGPGKICEAFAVTREQNDIGMTQGNLRFESRDSSEDIVQTTRIGISDGEDLELRFYERGNPHVSER
jgi:DNA-3-methyladenine glycosylase